MERSTIIPSQKRGAHSDTKSRLVLASLPDAINHFKTVKERLLRISDWKKIAGIASADFQLTDPEGKDVFRHAQKGDYMRIDLPAPGTEEGDGADWVRIEDIEERTGPDLESLSIRVRPSKNPATGTARTAHFFRSDATSTFMVSRKGRVITAQVSGRNEKPNVGASRLADGIRNFFVALGAILGFSKVQWKGLVNGLIEQHSR